MTMQNTKLNPIEKVCHPKWILYFVKINKPGVHVYPNRIIQMCHLQSLCKTVK